MSGEVLNVELCGPFDIGNIRLRNLEQYAWGCHDRGIACTGRGRFFLYRGEGTDDRGRDGACHELKVYRQMQGC